jgi:hypothetical protein
MALRIFESGELSISRIEFHTKNFEFRKEIFENASQSEVVYIVVLLGCNNINLTQQLNVPFACAICWLSWVQSLLSY